MCCYGIKLDLQYTRNLKRRSSTILSYLPIHSNVFSSPTGVYLLLAKMTQFKPGRMEENSANRERYHPQTSCFSFIWISWPQRRMEGDKLTSSCLELCAHERGESTRDSMNFFNDVAQNGILACSACLFTGGYVG